ncbi:MAG: competence/damage-inducible protein A [Planctomycetota bacterium]|jgi:nicotinamide-nucleotide amidase
MIKASIVTIGNEILSGQTVDTNTAHLSTRLLSINIPVVSSYTVRDEMDAIVRGLDLAGADADVILATGGLGPTDDDLTRQALAKFLGVELELQDELLDKIQQFFVSRNKQMPERNKIQAYIPAGAKALTSIGTAPGIMAEPCTRRGAGESKGKLFFALPGVPVEMKRMFEESVLPELERLAGGQAMVVKKLKCFGAGESTIAELLGTMMQRGRNPLINCTASSGIITLHIIATAENKEKAEQMAEKDQKLLQSTLGELIYGVGDQSLAEVVGEELARQGKTIAVAESCTGGLLAKFLTDNPGSSKYFTFGWITYSNEAKSSQLDVPVELIKQHGAVSEQVARAMAVGARKKAGTDYAISITGIAGPTGGTEQKPVGLVYIGVDSENGCETERCFFYHGRQFIRLRAAQTVLNILRLKLID